MAKAANTGKVLIIEDNLINQKVIYLMVTRLGFSAHVVENGAKGLEAIEQNEYRAVFVDLGLPDVNGFEVIRRLRARTDEKAKWPVIVLTAGGTKHDKDFVLANGANVYLFKPVTYEILREAIIPWVPEVQLSSIA
jgi:DNA-binding response OmpR family regulator